MYEPNLSARKCRRTLFHVILLLINTAHNVGPLSTRQRNAIQMGVRWRAGGGPLLDGYLDKVGSRLQESPVVCFHTSTHRPKSISLRVRQCRKERHVPDYPSK